MRAMKPNEDGQSNFPVLVSAYGAAPKFQRGPSELNQELLAEDGGPPDLAEMAQRWGQQYWARVEDHAKALLLLFASTQGRGEAHMSTFIAPTKFLPMHKDVTTTSSMPFTSDAMQKGNDPVGEVAPIEWDLSKHAEPC